MVRAHPTSLRGLCGFIFLGELCEKPAVSRAAQCRDRSLSQAFVSGVAQPDNDGGGMGQTLIGR